MSKSKSKSEMRDRLLSDIRFLSMISFIKAKVTSEYNRETKRIHSDEGKGTFRVSAR